MVTMFLGPFKAFFEEICGDHEGAKETMDEFSKTNPFVAPLRFAADALAGDEEDAKETLQTFGRNLENVAESTPVVGHAIAGGHALAGNEEKAKQVFWKATRTTVVAAAGIAGGAAGGPGGAAAAGAAAGTAFDTMEAVAGGEKRGIPKLIEAAAHNGQLRPGDVFDCCMQPVGDTLTGVTASQLYDKINKAYEQNQARHQVQKANDAKLKPLEEKLDEQGVEKPRELAENMSRKAADLETKVADNADTLKANQTGKIRNDYHKSGHVSATMFDEDGNESTGYSARLTKATGEERFTGVRPKLEEVQPNAKWIDTRRPQSNCAEPMSFERLPNDPTLTYVLQIKDGIVKTIARCKNCAQYNFGLVITDLIPDVNVPFDLGEVPLPASYLNASKTGIFLLSCEGKPNKGSS